MIIFADDSINAGTLNTKVTFNDSSQNIGIINNDVIFNDNSSNANIGIVNGNIILNDCAKNYGTVNGVITNNQTNCPETPQFNPPLLGSWVTNGNKRKLVILGSRNSAALIAAFGNSNTIDGGPWQQCPTESCFAYPALYRPLAYVNFTMDYEDKPNYLNYPGNPE